MPSVTLPNQTPQTLARYRLPASSRVVSLVVGGLGATYNYSNGAGFTGVYPAPAGSSVEVTYEDISVIPPSAERFHMGPLSAAVIGAMNIAVAAGTVSYPGGTTVYNTTDSVMMTFGGVGIAGAFAAPGGGASPVPTLFTKAYSMPNLTAGKRLARLGNRPSVILVVGESTAASFGAVSPNYRQAGFPGQLRQLLNQYQQKATNSCFCGTGNFGIPGTYNTNVVIGAGWAGVDAGNTVGGGNYISTGVTAGTLDFYPDDPFDSFIVLTSGMSSAASINVLVDGVVNGAAVTQNSSAYIGATNTYTVAGPMAAHKISFQGMNANNGGIKGCITWNSRDPGVIVLSAGCGGAGSAMLSLSATDGLAYVPANWGSKFNIDAYVINLTINDCSNNVAIATQTANYQASINQIRTKSSDIVFIGNQPFNGANYLGGPGALQKAMLQNFASTYSYNFIDLQSVFLSYAEALAAGLMADGLHPQSDGYLKYAQALYNAMS